LQKIEEIKLLLSKNEVDSSLLLSMVSNLKLVSPRSKLFDPLATWLNKPVNLWKLLYKWTKDEKTLEAWHKQCDKKGPTVTIVWANGGYAFGGYTPLPWESTSSWKESKESFIFSLTDGKGRQPYQCLPYQNFQYCVYHGSDRIIFGGGIGNDIWLRIPPQYNDSYSTVGCTYKLPPGFEGRTFLAGSNDNWQIEEIETYLV